MPRRTKETRALQKKGQQIINDAFEGQFVPAVHDAFGLLTGETASPLLIPNIPAFFGADPVIPGTRQLSGDIGNVLFPGQQEELSSQLDERFVTSLPPAPTSPDQATARGLAASGIAMGALLPFGVAGGAAAQGDDLTRILPDTPKMGPFQFRPPVKTGRQVSGSTIVNQVDDATEKFLREIEQRRGVRPINDPPNRSFIGQADESLGLSRQGPRVQGTAEEAAESVRQVNLRAGLTNSGEVPANLLDYPSPPSPTGKELLQDAAERAFQEGDVVTGTALRQELIRMEGSVQIIDDASRRAAADAGLGPVAPTLPTNEAEALFQSQAMNEAFGGSTLPKSGQISMKSPKTSGSQAANDAALFDITSPTNPEIRLAGVVDELQTPLPNVPERQSLSTTDFFSRGPGKQARGIKLGAEEIAADTGSVFTSGEGTLFGPGQRSLNHAIDLGLMVEVPGHGALIRARTDPKMAKQLKGMLDRSSRGKLTPEDKFIISQDPEIREAIDTFSFITTPRSAVAQGGFGLSTASDVGTDTLIEQVFRMLEGGMDPANRATGGRIG